MVICIEKSFTVYKNYTEKQLGNIPKNQPPPKRKGSFTRRQKASKQKREEKNKINQNIDKEGKKKMDQTQAKHNTILPTGPARQDLTHITLPTNPTKQEQQQPIQPHLRSQPQLTLHSMQNKSSPKESVSHHQLEDLPQLGDDPTLPQILVKVIFQQPAEKMYDPTSQYSKNSNKQQYTTNKRFS